MPEPDSVVIQSLRAFRERMNGQEDATVREMGVRWLGVESKLDANIAALANEMLLKQQAGDTVTAAMVQRAERYQILKAQLADEVKKYNKDAVNIISSGQERAFTLGIDSAQNAIYASYPSPLSANFNKINVKAVENMIGFAGDGSPLSSLLKNDYGDAADGLLQSLVNSVALGQSAEQTARAMRDGLGMGLDRSLLIARTELNRSYRTASTEQYRESGVVVKFKRLVARDEACLACIALDSEEFELAEELSDHPNGRAELPNNLILTDSPATLETFRHNDYVFVISTASGKQLTVTANHPILTDRGWMAAAFIHEGDNVISAGGGDWASSLMSPNNNNIPTLAKDLAHTFGMFRLGSVPISAKHFYCNGEGGEIDVIFINRFLWDSFNAALRKQVRKFFFGVGSIRLGAFNPLSAIEKMSDSLKRTANSILRFFYNGVFLRLSHVDIPETIGFGEIARHDALTYEILSNDLTGDIELFGDLVFSFSTIEHGANRRPVAVRKDDFVMTVGGHFRRLDCRSFGFTPKQPLSLQQISEGLLRSVALSGSVLDTVPSQIAFDRVVKSERKIFSGHVYSLQTKLGWYVSDGIISHNCTVVPVLEGMDAPTWEPAQDWFAAQPESKQREIMGNTRFEMYQNGTPLDAFATRVHSNEWGDSPAIVPIRDL